MTKSLRFRLFLSYFAVALIILLAAGITLGIAWQGAQDRIMRARLNATLPLTSRVVRTMLQQGHSPAEVAAQLADDLAQRHARLLLVQKGQVVGDTAGEMVGQPLLSYLPRPRERKMPAPAGVFVGPDGRRYYYALKVLKGPTDSAPTQAQAPLLVIHIAARRFGDWPEEAIRPLVWAALAALLAGLIFSWLISRWITRPLTSVAAAADEIARGNLDFQLEVSGPDEVKQLARQFNAMAAEVKAARQAQRAFIANVSHDLKTPLTAIQGFSQALVEGVASDPAGVQRAAHIIHEEALRMGRLVSQLLDLARLDAGRVQIQRQPVAVGKLLTTVVQRFQAAAEAKSLSLTVDVAPDLIIVGDEERLAQVFMNLLDNAVRHTPSGGQITCRAVVDAAASDHILISISDTGPGIAPQDLPHVFDRFYQAEQARRRGSAGLGLAIVQEIVRAHGGRVGVRSQPGQGATFWVQLPRKLA